MKPRWITLACAVTCLTACDSGKRESTKKEPPAKPQAPREQHFIEAETCTVEGEKTESPYASGSAFVERQSGGYQPVLSCEVPVAEKKLTVWLRRNGGPVQMKISAGETQSEGQWAYDEQEQFVWTSFGEIEPGGKGRELIFIGNDKPDQTVSIDCVLFTEGPLDDKDSLLTPLPVIPVDPAAISGSFRSAPNVWGVNLFSGGNSKILTDPAYIENLAYLAPHIVRVHNSGQLGASKESANGMIDMENKTWDEEKVRASVKALLELRNVGDIIINIPNWPEWMDSDKDGFLDEASKEDYTALVARFAEIAWEFPAARERFLFEIPNERDNQYHADLVSIKQPHRIAELANIYLSAAARIRQVAPGARVGGPSALNSYNMDFHEQFIALTAPALDFYSVHLYVSGDKKESDSSILARAGSAYAPVKQIREILRKNSSGREIPLSVDEYNIAWGWEDREPRMTNSFGAVWDAWFMLTAFAAGADSAAAWNENDGIYGKFSPDAKRRPASHVFHTLNTTFAGSCAILETNEPELLQALVTQDGSHLLLVHRGLRDRTITLPEGDWKGWILKQGLEAPAEIAATTETSLPGVSVIYLER